MKDDYIPYYHFQYRKEFKDVLRIKAIQRSNRKRYYFKDGTYLPQYIAQETTKQFNFNSDYATFERVMIVIVHWFSDRIPKDLDNYHYKPFIDEIRRLKIIEDDSWENVGLTNIGGYADHEYIDLYVIPYQYYIEFLEMKLRHLFKKKYQISSIKEKSERKVIKNNEFEDDGFFNVF